MPKALVAIIIRIYGTLGFLNQIILFLVFSADSEWNIATQLIKFGHSDKIMEASLMELQYTKDFGNSSFSDSSPSTSHNNAISTEFCTFSQQV